VSLAAGKHKDAMCPAEVVELTDANFHDEVTYSKGFWMVEFFAPW
jgi:thioredoxin-like negative regulator of GroEL